MVSAGLQTQLHRSWLPHAIRQAAEEMEGRYLPGGWAGLSHTHQPRHNELPASHGQWERSNYGTARMRQDTASLYTCLIKLLNKRFCQDNSKTNPQIYQLGPDERSL